MGVLLYDKNADYSTNGIGHAGLYTSVTNGLLSLFETRRSATKTRKNSSPNSDLEAAISGNPVFNANSIDLTAARQIVFPSQPSNAGENTLAVILKIKNGGATNDSPVGSIPATVTTNGACYFVHWNRRVQFETTYHNSQTAPSTFVGNRTPFLDMPSDGSLDGTFQMFVVTLKSEVGATIHRPSSGSSNTAALTAGQFFYYVQNITDRNFRGLAGAGTAQQGISMFAHWDRVLSAGEISTFYAEIRDQYALLGLTI